MSTLSFVQQSKSGAGGGASAVSAKIATFRPGLPSDASQNVFATWAGIQTWIAANEGFKIIQVDDRNAAADTGGSGVTDANGDVLLVGVVIEGNPLQAGFGFTSLSVLDGDTLRNFTQFRNIRILGLDTTGTADSLEYTLSAITDGILLERSIFRQNGTNPMISASSPIYMQLTEESLLDRGSDVVLSMGSELLRIELLGDSGIDGNVIANGFGAFVEVEFDESSSNRFGASQPQIAGTLTGTPLLPGSTSVTISGGSVLLGENAHNHSMLIVGNEGGVDDTLTMINGGATITQNLIIVLRKTGNGVTTVDETGNITLARGEAFLVDDTHRLTLQWTGSEWVEVSRNCGTRESLVLLGAPGTQGMWVPPFGEIPAGNTVVYNATFDINFGQNAFAGDQIDSLTARYRVPRGMIRTLPVRLRFRYTPNNNNSGDVEWFLRALRVPAGSAPIGAVPIAFTTSTIVSIAAGLGTLFDQTLEGVIPGLLEDDELTVQLRRDGSAGNLNDTLAAQLGVTSIEVSAIVVD